MNFLGGEQRRRSKVCMKGQDLCGNQCYDYNSYSCLEGFNGQRKFLCDKDEVLCGEKCYDPYEFNCYGAGDDALLCPWNERKCGRKCYNPDHETCTSRGQILNGKNQNGIVGAIRPISTSFSSFPSSSDGIRTINRNTGSDDSFTSFDSFNNNNRDNSYAKLDNNNDDASFTCLRHNLLCGVKCYDPTKQTCFRESAGGSSSLTVLCSIGQKRCSNKCYDPYRETCSENHDHQIDSNNQYKFNSPSTNTNNNKYNSFAPSSSSSSLNNANECPRGYSLCDGLCYNPFEEDCLTNSNSNKRRNKPAVTSNSDGFVRVSNPRQEFTPSSSLGSGGSSSGGSTFGWPVVGCRSGQLKRGTSCYDPRREECLNWNKGQIQRCESGLEVCGKKCYDPFNQKCLDDGYNRKVVCQWNERACRGSCYDPFRDNCD
ncbi:hypothetical protein Fcan01_09429 [Folsomia candida]|uniref:Uncharacterized protein n=1 Tax=Folsomia candida TaxID=158441 RepID=A0A226EDT4_FOLCA|nr:hypothetical protein Fcan01_09429 [Folsomia candida]